MGQKDYKLGQESWQTEEGISNRGKDYISVQNRKQALVMKFLMKQFAYFYVCYSLVGVTSFQTVKSIRRWPLKLLCTQGVLILNTSDSMPRNTFEHILRNLHLRDNKQLDKYDIFSKVVPLINKSNRRFSKFSFDR